MWLLRTHGDGDEYPRILINTETGIEIRLKKSGSAGSIVLLGSHYNSGVGTNVGAQEIGRYESYEEASQIFKQIIIEQKARDAADPLLRELDG